MTTYPPVDAKILKEFPSVDEGELDRKLCCALKTLNRKIIVLDDDPTGVQTVHDVSVYTDWSIESLREAFAEESSLFFVLTNSRSFTKAQTEQAHREIAQNIVRVSNESGKDFLVISRGDSTLRGHYPEETEVLRSELETLTAKRYDGEVVYPFFPEGGRYTIGNVHYVKEGQFLIPCGETEFARDKTFGYRSSHLGDWCEEKTEGRFPSKTCVFVSLESLRACDVEGIAAQLESVCDFRKVIVNSVDYCDVKVFTLAFLRAVASGKEFLFRSAAAIVKVLGGISDRPLLIKKDLIDPKNKNGGLIVVGSHVQKTTQQLEALHQCNYPVQFVEFNQHLALEPDGLEREVTRVVGLAGEMISHGQTVVVYTRRDRLDLDTHSKEAQLLISVRISNAVAGIVEGLEVRPNFIIAKGGITSSDIGTKALKVKRARVMGQIRPGIPVWMTGPESKFPEMPYVIFPGNVGEVSTLREVVETLLE